MRPTPGRHERTPEVIVEGRKQLPQGHHVRLKRESHMTLASLLESTDSMTAKIPPFFFFFLYVKSRGTGNLSCRSYPNIVNSEEINNEPMLTAILGNRRVGSTG